MADANELAAAIQATRHELRGAENAMRDAYAVFQAKRDRCSQVQGRMRAQEREYAALTQAPTRCEALAAVAS